jgi:hypothetical protein
MTRRAANRKGLGNAISNDDSRSSKWLRTKDFLSRDLRHRLGPGCLRHVSFAGFGACDPTHQFTPASIQAE